MNYSRITLGGQLMTDPNTKTGSDGKSIVTCTVQWETGWGDRKARNEIGVVLFGKTADSFLKYHKGGSGAFVEGELRWDVRTGKHYISASAWHFTGGPKRSATTEPVAGASAASSQDNDDLPF